jgi:hypothetical protein
MCLNRINKYKYKMMPLHLKVDLLGKQEDKEEKQKKVWI